MPNIELGLYTGTFGTLAYACDRDRGVSCMCVRGCVNNALACYIRNLGAPFCTLREQFQCFMKIASHVEETCNY